MLSRRRLVPLALASFVLACMPTSSATDSPTTEPVLVESSGREPTTTLTPPPSDLVQLPLYWAQLRDGKIELDAHDISPTEYEPLGVLEFDDSLVLAAGDPRIPARFAYGQPFVVASEAGLVRAKVERVTLVMGDGVYVNVTLAADGPLTAKHGMVAFPSASSPTDAKIRLPERVADGDPVRAKLLASVNAALKTSGLPKARGSELQVDRVTLRGEVRFVVATQVFDGKDPEQDEGEAPTGLALADANGKVVEWMWPLGESYEAYEILLVLDLDGDGLDELIYRSSYSEGAFWYLLRLDPSDPTKYESVEIAGSGL